MKINDLSKQYGVTNAVMIKYLKENGFKASSHMQTATDEMIEAAKSFKIPIQTKTDTVEKKQINAEPVKSTKIFKPDDTIVCRSVVPWKLTMVGVDRVTVYHWEGFGDIEYVAYKDLQSWRRKEVVLDPKIIIEDPDVCDQWKRELGEIYKPFIGVDYPEELFDLSDDEFVNLIKTGSSIVREIVKTTAINMIKNENYPSLNKIKLIDDTLGTCIKEFV